MRNECARSSSPFCAFAARFCEGGFYEAAFDAATSIPISRCAALYRDAHLADCGLSGWQAPYIPEICAAPGITQDQLALRLHVNRSNVTRQLAMLEENGFVLRRRSESDRRAVEVYPTQKAEETLSAVRAVYRSWREKLFYDLTSEERDRLESLLERLARRAEDIQ